MSAFTGSNVRFAKAVRLLFLNLKNIQQPTSNIELRTSIGCRARFHWMLGVGCSMFDVSN